MIEIMRLKNILILLFLFVLFSTPLFSQDITVLWWNVKNLFDTVDDPGKGDTVLDEQRYTEKIAELAEVIAKIDALMVGLSEVENLTTLKDLAEKSGYPYYYLVEGNDPRGIDICLLSRIKVDYISHKDLPTPYKDDPYYKFSRDCPEIILNYQGKTIHMLLNHLKSKSGDAKKSLKKRIAQVNGILDIIAGIYEKKGSQSYVIVAGDLNSSRYSEPLNILQKSGLKNINYLYSESKVFTYIYKKKKQELDYFLMNENLYYDLRYIKLKAYNSKKYAHISDHYPLLLKLTF